jgi:RNA polymerase sigma-70 factor (ECF subfamily)
MRMERIELTEDDVRKLEYLGGEVKAVDLLDELPTEQRSAVRARLVDGLPYGEIAVAQGVSEAAIRQRVSRGLAGLRRRMRGDA